MNADSSKKFVSWYIKSLCSVFIIIVFVFFYRFGFNFNTTLETWVHSASFFNNILTPPLLAITSVFILLTWRTSKTELEATKTLLEKQLASKDLVEDLETFSRRLSDLSNVERLSLNPGAKSRLKFYLVSTLDMNNNLYSHAAQWMEGLADSLDKREFTLYYLSQVDLEVRKCIESYSRLMEHDMTLPEVISEWFSHPDVINLVAGFAFIKSSEGQIWVSSFSKLLKNVCNKEASIQAKYLDEMFFRIDVNFALTCIQYLNELGLTDEQKEIFLNYHKSSCSILSTKDV
ncbi:MAG TPA: hypothetical protein ENH88_00515 [Pseudoalteromonas prydzensis]|uniref:Phage abortive infection protein n=1 Tax=Pseudoalteromonas prydzensis TaxID=182141 RepID=A0A7V1CV84_9GAMM|nr:hypothetical protein [Pseudoalteromonas prydzensis]HEA14941.1 hypothetical protein [Pseudoalteromonas prydzensis]